MPASEKQLAGNRRNAARSTGPRTPAGKDAVRHNALKHGILARDLLPRGEAGPETEAEFVTLLTSLTDEVAPVGFLEELLVGQIATQYRRLRRVYRSETGEIGRSFAEQAQVMDTGSSPDFRETNPFIPPRVKRATLRAPAAGSHCPPSRSPPG